MLFHMMSSELNDNSLIIFLENNYILRFFRYSLHLESNNVML